MSEQIRDELDEQIDSDPEFLKFWEHLMKETTLTGVRRIAYVAWDAGWDTGYAFSESINKALQEIDFRSSSITITSSE